MADPYQRECVGRRSSLRKGHLQELALVDEYGAILSGRPAPTGLANSTEADGIHIFAQKSA
jgi:hypothetical protein